ncbi:MAG: hypothetical protein PHI97_31320 [Desulfobulbus sp.]|nr:hypothetical protein [Desulfobulbus sp.]
MKGMISIQGKGGKMKEIAVTPATYVKLEQAVEKGWFEVSPSAYREGVKMLLMSLVRNTRNAWVALVLGTELAPGTPAARQDL